MFTVWTLSARFALGVKSNDSRRGVADAACISGASLNAGVNPGGEIMIHGLPNTPKRPEASYQGVDWTDGCIAVSNSDMIDLWRLIPVSTPIQIRP